MMSRLARPAMTAVFHHAFGRLTRTRRLQVLAVLAVLVLAVFEAITPEAAVAATTLISINLTGAAAGGSAFHLNPGSVADMSPDGRFLLFASTATDLVAGVNDTNGIADIFLRDLQMGTTDIISVDAAGNALGTAGNDALGGFVFSPDSKRLLFRTQATNIVPGLADTNDAPDWFVRDLIAGTTSCVTINADGTSTGDLTSFTNQPPVFSPDGKSIAFISLANDLVAGVPGVNGRDLFLRDLDAGTTSLISVTTGGAATGSNTDDPPQFSPNGRYLAFLNSSPNLVLGVTDQAAPTKLFVRDLQTDTTYLVTRTLDDQAAMFTASYEWTPDGHAILFSSPTINLVAGVSDTNNGNDLFLWDTQTHAITMVTVDPAGAAAGDRTSISFGVSSDSRYVAFSSASTNLTPESAGGDFKADLYVRDTQTDTTTYVARNDTASVAFPYAQFVPDGRHLAFTTNAPDVVPGLADTNGQSDLFLYDLQSGANSAVTINFDGTATANTAGVSHDDIVFSPNGRYVSFVSDAADLVPNFTTTATRDLFVRDLVAGVTSLVTVYIDGGGAGYGQGSTRDAWFSADSNFLLFVDNALLATAISTPFNFNFSQNLYAFDVCAQVQNILSVNADGTAPATTFGNGSYGTGVEPFSFIVSPAGGSVVFLSDAFDMVAGVADTPHSYDVFLATLPTPLSPPAQCGDPVPDASLTTKLAPIPRVIKASDALFILRTAVGSESCDACVCDVDGSGTISATDALLTLKSAVGQQIELTCPPC